MTGVPAETTLAKEDSGDSFDLKVAGLSKSFRKTRVLSGVEFFIRKGEAVALIGANGAGKSTLLRCCVRLVEPDTGSIRLLKKKVTGANRRELRSLRTQVGFVFQKHNLIPRLSVLTNVLHGAQSRGRGPRFWLQGLAGSRDREEAMYCLERVGLAHLAAKRADELSGGQSQRVAIARALMQRPRFMMADEPVASLDPQAGEEVMALFLDLIKREGLTLYYTSHNLEHALRYSDRILGIRNGRVALDAPSGAMNAKALREIYA
ncbi:MAG: phosphonate ABC transporter ATP-binding protein [Desulfovibrionales bacterium]